ncbi:hypothetical protein WJX82_009745 [Trebouxia sp. C0006]
MGSTLSSQTQCARSNMGSSRHLMQTLNFSRRWSKADGCHQPPEWSMHPANLHMHFQSCLFMPQGTLTPSVHVWVWTNEPKELQPRLHTLFEKYFEGFEVRSAREFEAKPDERMIYNSMDVGAWELKIDTNGNTYVVRCVCAIRCTLSKLAAFHQELAAQASPTMFRQNPSARLPYYFATAYPETSVQQLLLQKLIFLVSTTNSQQRLVKFVPCCQNGSWGGTEAHRAWAAAQCAPDLLQVKSLRGEWYAVEMEYLAPRDGWFPLCILAPGRRQTVPGSQPEPLTVPAWQHACDLATQALERAHQHATMQLDGHRHPTVHGDVRLPNNIGHVGDGNEVDQVVFVDFDWAGLQGITRYPVLMNPDVAWPTGAQPYAQLQQAHDKDLLKSELQKGSAA